MDGALFSRIPVSGCRSEANLSLNQSNPSLSAECIHSKLLVSNERRWRKKGDKNVAISKREPAPILRSKAPQYKPDKSLSKLKIPEGNLRSSAPCSLDKDYLDSRNDQYKPQIRTGSVKHTRTNDQQISSNLEINSRLSNSSQCVDSDRAYLWENIELDNSKEEIGISIDVTRNSDGSSLDENDIYLKDETLFDTESQFEPTSKNDDNKSANTEHEQVERLIEDSEDNSSKVNSVFYVNEDEAPDGVKEAEAENASVADKDGALSTNPLASSKNKVTQKTDSFDFTDSKFSNSSEVPRFENNTEKIALPDIVKNDTNLETVSYEERQSPVCCRIVPALVLPVLSLSIYVWDIGSDIRLAIAYKVQDEMDLFWITLACIVIPLILMSIVDISWLWLDKSPSCPGHSIRYLLGVCTFGRIVRSLNYMCHIVKSVIAPSGEERTWHKKRATEEKRDCYMLDFINAFAESVPQLFVQMYLLYAFDLELTKVRVLNLLSSWASIAWTYSAYYRCNREIESGEQDLKFIGFVVFFVSVLSSLAARVICVVLFLVYFKAWIGCLVLGVHFIVMLLWIVFREKPKLDGTSPWKLGKCLYYVFFAYVSLLCFLNLRDSPTKLRMLAFYVLIYIENLVMAALAFFAIYVSDTGNEKLCNLLALPVGFVLHISLLITYYQIFHPKTGKCT